MKVFLWTDTLSYLHQILQQRKDRKEKVDKLWSLCKLSDQQADQKVGESCLIVTRLSHCPPLGAAAARPAWVKTKGRTASRRSNVSHLSEGALSLLSYLWLALIILLVHFTGL